MPGPQRFATADALVDALLARLGKRVVLGLPVGIGKAPHIANALYRRACEDPSLQLTIFTALTLERPRAGGELERRFLEPLADRLFAGWPELDYAHDLHANALPSNVEVRQFYFRPAAFLASPLAQQGYTSINYTQVAAELLELGVNAIAQLVTERPENPGRLSLGSNPEVTLDLLPELAARCEAGQPVVIAGQLNREMPYMTGDAEVDAAGFDLLLDAADCEFPLFGIPRAPVSASDYATGLHVASLVPDGGSLQIGIGSLSDAVAHCLRLRQQQPALFAELLARLPGAPARGRPAALPPQLGAFEQGLYVCTELLSDAIFALFEAGIVRRPADAASPEVMHAGFFVGSQALYRALRELPEADRERIGMRAISFVNSLYGDEMRKRAQRRDARFVNEAMMATLLGAAVSDGLEDGRVVSGVGGQFDFVRQAAALPDARSIIMLSSIRRSGGRTRSNIRWRYGHVTVPRHCRDLFVTEYGIADTRGLPDAQVIAAMLSIADSAFQHELARQAQSAGKLPADFALPAWHRDNHRERLEDLFASPRYAAHFPRFPLGTELTTVEQHLAPALRWLKAQGLRDIAAAIWRHRRPALQEAEQAALERMALAAPAGWRERWWQRLVLAALREIRE